MKEKQKVGRKRSVDYSEVQQKFQQMKEECPYQVKDSVFIKALMKEYGLCYNMVYKIVNER